MEHLTLDTGHSRHSPRDEVDQAVLSWCQDRLLPGLADQAHARVADPVRLPRDLRTYGVTLARAERGLVATAWGLRDDDPEARLPLATWWVAPDPETATDLWPLVCQHYDRAAAQHYVLTGREAAPIPDRPATMPWCVVALEVGIAYLPAATSIGWLGDLERCLAWAWIDQIRSAP